MNNSWKQWLTISLGIATTCFSFIPDDFFSQYTLFTSIPQYWNDSINRVIFALCICFFVYLILFLWERNLKCISINGKDYKISVQYGDILKAPNCIKVINFDECFTSEVGNAPYQIKPTSLCGQFLRNYPEVNPKELLSAHKIKPLRKHSDFGGKACYEPGTLLPLNDFLIMAFGKLNSDGRASMSRDDYLHTLNNLWKELNKYYNQSDIAIPVLGAGITSFQGESLSQQQLVDIIIASYKLSSYKIKRPNTLRIITKKREDFSLNKIGETV